jgi:CRP/FNR family transcriptional regulator, cyclic AMP receptor protein
MATDATSAWASELPVVIGQALPRMRSDTRQALVRVATIRSIGAGKAVLGQGDESSIALVLDGHVAVRRTTNDGRQLIVGFITRGGLVSVLPLAARPALADAVALTPTVAAIWSATGVRALATRDAGLAVDLLDQVLGKFEVAVARMDALLSQNALRRVARVLELYSDLFFSEPPVLKRTHLPALVGTSREMTGRVVRALESRGIVARVGRDRIRLLDPAALAAIAEAIDRPRSAGDTRTRSQRMQSAASLDHSRASSRGQVLEGATRRER